MQINGADARSDASQGQRRTAVLAMKLAEMELMEALTGETPILLLDDVFSELDTLRRDLLRARISSMQTLLTCVDAETLRFPKNTRLLHIRQGQVMG